MDFDPNAASHSAQVALYAMESRQAGHPAAAAPPHVPKLAAAERARMPQHPTTGLLASATNSLTDGLATGRTSRPTTYHDLPPEVLQQVADHVPFDDIGNLSTVDKQTYHVLRERWLSRRCWQRAKAARNVPLSPLESRDDPGMNVLDHASMQQLLTEIERIRVEPALRAEPLKALWPAIRAMRWEQQQAAFEQVFEAAGRVPKQGLQIQNDMIRAIHQFSRSQPRCNVYEFVYGLYKFVYAQAERRSAEQGSTWAAVASLLGYLDNDASQLWYEGEYQAFWGRLPALRTAEQADLIAELAILLPRVFRHGSGRSAKTVQYYETLLAWVRRLPPSYQGAPIGALAHSIRLLPDAHRPMHYANLRHLILALPDHQLDSALRCLPFGLTTLPTAQYAHELSLLDPVFHRVLPKQRASVALGLLKSTKGLNETLSKQLWQRALRLLESGDETDVQSVLKEMKQVMSSLPLQHLEDAKIEIRAFVDRTRFSEETRQALLDYSNPNVLWVIPEIVY
ncbi:MULTISPECIES: F-box domain-containing protein [Mycetohabitans]|uniref:F-box domain-containing protein n=1 Tax=Mycetohabitans TaxID=2571159 RepID=UPI001F46E7F0|nr:F-box domain-containing protein [Mycetohabitans sp. B3]MCF2134062.1 F-box domain-containing protein [Mycetohabitans sp. B3]